MFIIFASEFSAQVSEDAPSGPHLAPLHTKMRREPLRTLELLDFHFSDTENLSVGTGARKHWKMAFFPQPHKLKSSCAMAAFHSRNEPLN